MTKEQQYITIRGAKQNNLKGIDLEIPKQKLTVITGLSGSGKSSLAFDVLNREGQRHYFQHLAAGSRLGIKMQKANVTSIQGLTPCLSISQNKGNFNPRSTVGTMSDIYDLLRLLFARLGKSTHSELLINRSLFSFNHKAGACPNCKGLGVEDKISVDLLLEDASKSIRDKAFKVTQPNGYTMYSQVTIDALNQVCEAHGFNVDTPWNQLSEEHQNVVMNGSNRIQIPFGKHTLESRMTWTGITAKPREEGYYKGIIPVMEEILLRDRNPNILKYAKTQLCSVCNGARLSEQALTVKIQDKNIGDYSKLNIQELTVILQSLAFKKGEHEIATPIIESIVNKTNQINEFGLGYLRLSRLSSQLNGGELQRIRLAQQLNAKLRNLTYIFDEPSIGVHPSQNKALLNALRSLVNQGNTVVVVEHDQDTIQSADWIVEIGPMAGEKGGELLFSGPKKDYLHSTHNSLSRASLAGQLTFPEANMENEYFEVEKASINNLKDITVPFAYQQLNVVVGVAGAGKSSLVYQTLLPLLNDSYHQQIHAHGNPNLINTHFNKIYEVDQSPIGKTVRSTPATYTKIHDSIRDVFASLEEAKRKGFSKSTFSYNSKGGRCENCEGSGRLETGMHFIGKVESVCPSCKGKRYNADVLEVKYKGKTISDILDLSISQALAFFQGNKKLSQMLEILDEIGLGYLKLGQSSNTLSGGEAQRIKLATELMRSRKDNALFILNEPSTGLHFYDIHVLMNLFERMLKKGDTLILIENNEHIISVAHHIIELGPGAGQEGGQLVFSGDNQLFTEANTLTSNELSTETKQNQISASKESTLDAIELLGVRTHHLNIPEIRFEDNKHTVISGPSGSGKTSLAFDTLYVEARNQFLESFPAYLRQQMRLSSSAQYDSIKGLTPVIALRQRNDIKDPRSTLASLSHLSAYYRLLFARLGENKNPEAEMDLNHSSSYSTNHNEGSCEHCKGLGKVLKVSTDSLVRDKTKSIFEGALKKHKSLDFIIDSNGQYVATIQSLSERFGYDYSVPFKDLSTEEIDVLFNGNDSEVFHVKWNFDRKGRKGTHTFEGLWKGFEWLLLDEYYRKKANNKGDELLQLLIEVDCPICHGMRLKDDVLNVTFGKYNISQFLTFDINWNVDFFQSLIENPSCVGVENEIIEPQAQLFEDILNHLKSLQNIGLGYLHLDRRSMSLSGGELQKVHLASILNAQMSGICYVLDEPTSGLHPSETPTLLASLTKILELGNTLISIEHNIDFIKAADVHISLGPNAGEQGGEICSYDIDSHLKSYLTRTFKREAHTAKDFITIRNASANNLIGFDVKLGKGIVTAISGVSGSGKTSLMRDVLYASWKQHQAVNCIGIDGLENISNILWVDRKGAEPSAMSTVASYVDLYPEIRKVFAKQAQREGEEWKQTHFNFQNKLTQCPECKGKGYVHHKLDFVNDVLSKCEICEGERFVPELLKIQYNGYSIAKVLEQSVNENLLVFSEEPKITKRLQLLVDLGLGYLKLGQLSSQISGGEAQRLKIARELLKNEKAKNLIILDEPGKGLHVSDLPFLLQTFDRLRSDGHTLVIIEHNPLLLLHADAIIDLHNGGCIYQGGLNEFIENNNTQTSRYLNCLRANFNAN